MDYGRILKMNCTTFLSIYTTWCRVQKLYQIALKCSLNFPWS